MARLPHFLDSRPTDGVEAASLTGRPPFIPQENSWYSFLLDAESAQGHSAAGRIRSTGKSNDLIGFRTRDLAACNKQQTATPWYESASELYRPSDHRLSAK
jgi:hypothetical protein